MLASLLVCRVKWKILLSVWRILKKIYFLVLIAGNLLPNISDEIVLEFDKCYLLEIAVFRQVC